jgi:hypothetical protein
LVEAADLVAVRFRVTFSEGALGCGERKVRGATV